MRRNASSDADTHQGQPDTLGLLDQDPAVQSRLELFGDQVGLVDGTLLEEPDGGDVGERLRQRQVAGSESRRFDAEQVHGADDLVPKP